MHFLSNSTRSFSSSEPSWEASDPSEFAFGKKLKELIVKANTLNLPKLFKHYHLKIDELNRKSTCPFPHHKNGQESSASFFYYPQTNTFWCFGCKTGSCPLDFVMHMDNISAFKAAKKIISIFDKDLDEEYIQSTTNFSEKLEILMSFSDWVRKNHSLSNIKEITKTFDMLYNKHQLSNIALKTAIDLLIK